MKLIKKIRNYFCNLYERYFGKYIPVREFDFQKAQEFYEAHRNDLKELHFCMGFDEKIYEPVIENGRLIQSPICFSCVDGVKQTSYDIPCFGYEFISGASGKFYCFKEFWYNQKSNTYKYMNPLYGPIKMPRYGIFDEEKFPDSFNFFNLLQKESLT